MPKYFFSFSFLRGGGLSVSSDQSLSRDEIGLFLLCGTPLVAFRRIVVGKRLVPWQLTSVKSTSL